MKRNTSLIVIVLVIVIGYVVVDYVRSVSVLMTKGDHIVGSTRVIDEYSKLFDTSFSAYVSHYYSFVSRERPPVVKFAFGDKYNVVIAKQWIRVNARLSDIVRVRNEQTSLETNVVYNHIDERTFDYHYRSGFVDTVKDIFISTFPLNLNCMVSNDSVLYYNGYIDNFSMGYYKEIKDVLITAKEQSIPMQVLFLKRRAEMFTIFASVRPGQNSLPPNFLLDHVIF